MALYPSIQRLWREILWGLGGNFSDFSPHLAYRQQIPGLNLDDPEVLNSIIPYLEDHPI